MTDFITFAVGVGLIFVVYIWPFMVTIEICKKRNRTVSKGVFITIFLGWLGTAGIWLALKTRRPDGTLA